MENNAWGDAGAPQPPQPGADLPTKYPPTVAPKPTPKTKQPVFEQESVTVDDVVHMVVRAILLHEQNRPTPPIVVQTPIVQTHTPEARTFTNAEIASLLPTFFGHGGDVQGWIEHTDAVQSAYDIRDDVMKLIAVGKLTGQAREWYLSRIDLVTQPWSMCKQELGAMFFVKQNRIAMMKAFEARKWKKNKAFSTYYSDKVILGNKTNIPESDLIDYVIEGLDHPMFESQAKMQEFKRLSDLLRVIKNITNDTKPSVMGRPHGTIQFGNLRLL